MATVDDTRILRIYISESCPFMIEPPSTKPGKKPRKSRCSMRGEHLLAMLNTDRRVGNSYALVCDEHLVHYIAQGWVRVDEESFGLKRES